MRRSTASIVKMQTPVSSDSAEQSILAGSSLQNASRFPSGLSSVYRSFRACDGLTYSTQKTARQNPMGRIPPVQILQLPFPTLRKRLRLGVEPDLSFQRLRLQYHCESLWRTLANQSPAEADFSTNSQFLTITFPNFPSHFPRILMD